MKKFLILHYGFVKPTPEVMEGWNQWFASIAERQVDRAHLPMGREISASGTKDMPLDRDSITGYTFIEAADLDEATAVAEACPFIDATRVYKIMSG